MTVALLADADRTTLALLADALIPPAAGRISASEAGIAGDLLDKIASLVPERLALIGTMVAAAREVGADSALETARQTNPADYDLFCETIAAAYFMAPAVREQVRFPGRVPVPAKIEVADLEDLLIPVLDAGFEPRGLSL